MVVYEKTHRSTEAILGGTTCASYIIPGNPIPLARPRYGKHGIWDSQKQQKLNYRLILENQLEPAPYFTGAIHLDAIFYFHMPKTSVKRLEKLRAAPHIFRPDLDNLIKFIMDAAQGVIFDDDCIISSISAKKMYDDTPRTEIVITQVR